MVSVNRSFLYGICFASITWTISLYLLYQLHRIDVKNINVPTYNLSKTYVNGQFKNSKDLIKNLQPIVWGGRVSLEEREQGLSMLGMVKTTEDQQIQDEGYRIHAFNTLISNRLALNRTIPDTRNKLCKDIKYPMSTLRTASVIICFYNEHLTTLLRSIQSILLQTPSNLLKEVILVDDYSDLDDLGTDLERHLANISVGGDKVQLVRNVKREGLIRSRVSGSRKAQGDVLVFLDSHVEVNIEWLEPLLVRIKENRSRIAMPIIDIINADTFVYSASPLVRGGFNWGLHFKWENLPKGTLSKPEDFIKPIKSPTMAGGLFAVDREYFVEMGEYDEGMEVWGGENLEISFRIWMCGGSLEMLPCSRVGHVFRARRPYGDPTDSHTPSRRHDSMTRNSLRVAHVWMDEYKQHYLSHLTSDQSGKSSIITTTTSNLSYGDISARVHLRNVVLHCKSFNWYLRHVYPEQTMPAGGQVRRPGVEAGGVPPQLEPAPFQPWHSRKREYTWHGQLRLNGTALCVQGDRQKRGKSSGIQLAKCAANRMGHGKESKNQLWWSSIRGELILAQLLCLQSGSGGAPPHLHKCHELGGDQQWQYNFHTDSSTNDSSTPIYNMAAGRCLGLNNAPKLGAAVQLTLCHNQGANKKRDQETAWNMLTIS